VVRAAEATEGPGPPLPSRQRPRRAAERLRRARDRITSLAGAPQAQSRPAPRRRSPMPLLHVPRCSTTPPCRDFARGNGSRTRRFRRRIHRRPPRTRPGTSPYRRTTLPPGHHRRGHSTDGRGHSTDGRGHSTDGHRFHRRKRLLHSEGQRDSCDPVGFNKEPTGNALRGNTNRALSRPVCYDDYRDRALNYCSAASYSPTGSPLQYHRR
jgi:hypothetical protein